MDTYALEVFIGTIIPSVLIPCFCFVCCICPILCCCKTMCKSKKGGKDKDDGIKFKYEQFKISDRSVNEKFNEKNIKTDKNNKDLKADKTKDINEIDLMNTNTRNIIQEETDNENDGLETNETSNKSEKMSQKYSIAYLHDINETTTTNEVIKFVNIVLSQKILPNLVILRINSPGGSVIHYGLIYSELLRIKSAKIRLVVCVDEMAASGGYLIACCADEIIVSEFATIGSIGVFMQAMNVSKIADSIGVKMEFFSAGEHKVPYRKCLIC